MLGAVASDWPLLAADSADPVSLAALARVARVVVSTVGPYRAQGLALVEACAAAGTDYADLTGEVLFIRDSIDRCHDSAARAGARLVHCCGFDSVPSDIGVLMLHHTARADGAGDLLDTTLAVTALRGGISGGTIASLMGQQDEVRASAERRRVVGDPYALSPDRAAEPDLGDERDLDWVTYDGDLRMWTGPFAMAGLNTRVVRRSNALQGWAYGRRFRYREVTGFGASPVAPVLAVTVSAALKAAEAGLAFGPSRAMLSRLLPAPGQGPGDKTRRTGSFRMQIHARTSAGARYLGIVGAQGDPGYAATSVMLGEAALCLALDREHLPDRAGVLTPATAMGTALADRLRSAGHTLATRQIVRLPRQDIRVQPAEPYSAHWAVTRKRTDPATYAGPGFHQCDSRARRAQWVVERSEGNPHARRRHWWSRCCCPGTPSRLSASLRPPWPRTAESGRSVLCVTGHQCQNMQAGPLPCEHTLLGQEAGLPIPTQSRPSHTWLQNLAAAIVDSWILVR